MTESTAYVCATCGQLLFSIEKMPLAPGVTGPFNFFATFTCRSGHGTPFSLEVIAPIEGLTLQLADSTGVIDEAP